MQSIDLIEKFAYGTDKDLVNNKEEIKCNNTMKLQKKLLNLIIVKENTKEHNGSGFGKTNLLFNLINQQPEIDKIYLYAKDPYEAKYQFLINKR